MEQDVRSQCPTVCFVYLVLHIPSRCLCLKKSVYYEFASELRVVMDDVPACSCIKSYHLLTLVLSKVIAYIV